MLRINPSYDLYIGIITFVLIVPFLFKTSWVCSKYVVYSLMWRHWLLWRHGYTITIAYRENLHCRYVIITTTCVIDKCVRRRATSYPLFSLVDLRRREAPKSGIWQFKVALGRIIQKLPWNKMRSRDNHVYYVLATDCQATAPLFLRMWFTRA